MIYDTLVTKLRELENNVPKWSELNKSEKNGFLCLGLMCEDCPLKYKDNNGNCRGKKYIYDYITNLGFNQNLDKKIEELKECMKASESVEDKSHYQTRINSYAKIMDQNSNILRSIIKSVSVPEIDESKIPDLPQVEESEVKLPKKKGRVWTEEQKARAVEARRKTWEAKKKATQKKEAKKIPAAVVKEEPKSEQPDRLDIARAIIDKRLEMAQDKVKSIEDKIQSLKDEGVELECVMPDFGRNELTHDMKVLDEAVEIIKKYLEL